MAGLVCVCYARVIALTLMKLYNALKKAGVSEDEAPLTPHINPMAHRPPNHLGPPPAPLFPVAKLLLLSFIYERSCTILCVVHEI